MLSLIMFHVIMNIKKNDTLSPCNSAGRKFEILKRCVPKMWLHMIRLDQLSPYGMTYQRGSKSKLFSIRTRLSLGQRALCRLDLRLTCLYSLASFIECSLAWLFSTELHSAFTMSSRKNQNNGKVTGNRENFI